MKLLDGVHVESDCFNISNFRWCSLKSSLNKN